MGLLVVFTLNFTAPDGPFWSRVPQDRSSFSFSFFPLTIVAPLCPVVPLFPISPFSLFALLLRNYETKRGRPADDLSLSLSLSLSLARSLARSLPPFLPLPLSLSLACVRSLSPLSGSLLLALLLSRANTLSFARSLLPSPSFSPTTPIVPTLCFLSSVQTLLRLFCSLDCDGVSMRAGRQCHRHRSRDCLHPLHAPPGL